jgi:tripartite-type tricarboxylate transporter receptor subunit TctC
MSSIKKLLLLFCIVGVAWQGAARADDYPARPVRILVAFGAGGSVDLVARLMAQELSKRLGQQVFVENRPGGGTVIATEALAHAAPDGYTLMMADMALGSAPAVVKHLPYDTLRDIAPIALIGSLPGVFAVSASNPAHTLAEYIKMAKAEPGKLNYGSAGVGSMLYLAAELFKAQAGVEVQQIPYKSNAEVMLALASGDVSMVIAAAPAMMSQRARLRFLAVSDSSRLESLPDVPTFAEAGMAKYNVQNWQGIIAPAGTNPAIISKLNRAVNEILKEPDVRAHLEKLGVVVSGGTPQKFENQLASDIARWPKLISAEKASPK